MTAFLQSIFIGHFLIIMVVILTKKISNDIEFGIIAKEYEILWINFQNKSLIKLSNPTRKVNSLHNNLHSK